MALDPQDHPVPELEEALDDIDDIDELETVLTREEAGENRKTAKEAIEARLDAVEEAAAEGGDTNAGGTLTMEAETSGSDGAEDDESASGAEGDAQAGDGEEDGETADEADESDGEPVVSDAGPSSRSSVRNRR